jgi:hypothetical protein
MPSHLERRLFFLLIVTLLWSSAMLLEANRISSPDFRAPTGCYFSGKPIVDAELAQTPACFRSIVTQGAEEGNDQGVSLVRANTYMDFLFIVLYWAIFVTFAQIENGWFSTIASFLITLAALADVWENLRILSGLRALESATPVDFTVPRGVSLIKWGLLGLVFLLLAAAVWGRKSRWYIRIAVALVITGVLLLLGLAFPRAMTVAGYGFVLVFVLLVARLWPYSTDTVLTWIEYGFLLRFQITAALILFLALPLAYFLIPSLFVGVFDAQGFVSFVFIVWAAFQLAWTVMVTSRLVLVYGPDRFARATFHPGRVTSKVVSTFGLLAVPLIVILFIGSDSPQGACKAIAALLGLLLAIGVLVLTAFLHFAIEDPQGHTAETIFPSFGFLQKKATPRSRFWTVIGSWLARHLPQDLLPGILDGERLRSGHEMAGIAVAVFLSIYVALGLRFSPAWTIPERQPAALFFLLLILTIFTWLLSGAAFFIDRTRLPVFTTLLVVSLLTGAVRSDHQYAVKTSKVADVGPLSPAIVIEAWKKKRGKDTYTMLVVATAGGGIRAGAWTAEVMTRLQQDCKAASDSLLLVSSVSGGSMGSMFVVAPYRGEGAYPTSDDELKQVRFNTERSSLGAVGWGLAYPDVLRTIPLFGAGVPETWDRGWSLEHSWSAAWRDVNLPTPTLADWRHDVRDGIRPAVIFNATASESGERFLVATTDAPFEGAKQFSDLFPGEDIDVSTAARLSATFPYVSPLARASQGSVKNGYHVGDGGYYDNSGLLSAVEWLSNVGDELNKYQVLLIVIDAKPGSGKFGSKWSWQRQLIGPVETLLHVRSSSQQVRESVELKMARKYLADLDPNGTLNLDRVIPEQFLFGSKPNPKPKSEPPLSWHLTKQQRKEIGGAWAADPVNKASWEDVRTKLGCSSNLDILSKAIEAKEDDE